MTTTKNAPFRVAEQLHFLQQARLRQNHRTPDASFSTTLVFTLIHSSYRANFPTYQE